MSLLKRKKLDTQTVKKQTKAVSSADIAQEIYRKNVELAHTNQTLSLLRTIDNLVLEPDNSLKDLSDGITKALVENSNYVFSAIYLKTSEKNATPMTLGGFGVVPGLSPNGVDTDALTKVKMYIEHHWYVSNELSVTIDIEKHDSDFLDKSFKKQAGPVRDFASKLNCKTLCIVKLLARRDLVGVLAVGLAVPADTLNEKEKEYLGRIGEAAGIAIDNKLLFEENQTVLKKLRESNDKLKALDEAKDEFISMASHQLRTPLTSVKGYVSMVLEGDMGKISTQQREMLEQAFASSQRMVYLIADLLNVSRLKTGKFVIEQAPTYLPDVIETEMKQLTESAKVHNLELTFQKPEHFPILNLDETKTRQVIMNFMDNAIYYTPSGGHIKVELRANDKVAEYRVVDDGLGVPKEEQHHLFTKFFRAGNAKKARPDGTGLGLYMAKKVVIAQGGSIIFESQENKGSTFGFSLPLADLEVKPL